MTRDDFHENMDRLERETLELGKVVAHEAPKAIDAVLRGDMKRLNAIVAHDRKINKERLAIEGQIILLIATQQPVAIDIRLLASLLEIVGEIERMGDYAKGIARIGVRLAGAPVPQDIADLIITMGNRCRDMFLQALDAFARRDAVAARQLIGDDEVIDSLYNKVFAAVLALGATDAEQMERRNYVLWIAHDLERTADRVTNICARTIYVATGALVADAQSAMEVRLSEVAKGLARNDSAGRGEAPSERRDVAARTEGHPGGDPPSAPPASD
jgi:phosphate transport system protein